MVTMRSLVKAAFSTLWLAFPVIPLLAEDTYHNLLTFESLSTQYGGPDPFDWDWIKWLLALGPLIGYGFLAGTTWGIEDGEVKGWWSVWSRRAIWVGLGPWLGLWILMATAMTLGIAVRILAACGFDPHGPSAPSWPFGPKVNEALVVVACVAVSLGWLPIARAALRRARMSGRIRSAWRTGLILAAAFLATLFGCYWCVTSFWGDYFFDATI